MLDVPFAHCADAGQDSATDPRLTSFVGDAEISKETVQRTDSGWTTAGSFDVLGTRKGSFRGAWSRDGATVRYELNLTNDGKERSLVATLADGKLKVRTTVGDAAQVRSKDVATSEVFALDNMIWADLLELGSMLAARDAAGTTPGTELTGISAAAATGFAVKVVDVALGAQVVADKRRRCAPCDTAAGRTAIAA